MAFETLLYDEQDSIGYLTLNRPDKLNALSQTLMVEFREALEGIEANPDVRVVILTGAGRAFSAGFDIESEVGGPDGEPLSVDGRRSRLKYNIETFLMVWNLSKPVIAAVNGYALGGRLRTGAGLRTSRSRRIRPCWASRKSAWATALPS